MSLKLNNVQLDAQARQDGISTNGKLGDRSASLKANVNASLPEGWSAKLTVTDKTASDVRACVCSTNCAPGAVWGP
jgi:PBP1b-binding outer membrane lipoprotein LpoB